MSELKKLAWDIGVDIGEVTSDNKGQMIRNIINYTERRHMRYTLVDYCQRTRPNSDWHLI